MVFKPELNITRYKEHVFAMVYVKKICPICGKEFVILENVEGKAIYCTLSCLIEAQEKFESRGMGFPSLG